MIKVFQALVHRDMSRLPGLVLRKVFLYVIKIRQRRERYHGGIKALGTHMHVVTKTMSDAADRQQQPPKGSGSSSNNNNEYSGGKTIEGLEGEIVAHRDPKAPRVKRLPSRAVETTRRRQTTPEIEIVETDIDAATDGSGTAKAQATAKAPVAASPSLLGRLTARNKAPPDPLEIRRQQEARRASRMHNFLANLE